MDINHVRIAVTLVALIAFVALVLRTWSRRREAEYRAAAALPFTGDAAAPAGPAAPAAQGEPRE